jgi:hypothetical protein
MARMISGENAALKNPSPSGSATAAYRKGYRPTAVKSADEVVMLPMAATGLMRESGAPPFVVIGRCASLRNQNHLLKRRALRQANAALN